MNPNKNIDRFRIPEKELRKFIWIFFSVGIVGMAIPWTREIFIRLVPVTFVVCLVILGMADHTQNRKLFWLSGVIFIVGYLVEVIGVNTGILFGHYGYSLHMGPALMGTPLVMGISWLMLLYLSVTVVQPVSENPAIRTLMAAVLMVVLDFLLEPAAIWMKMWRWEGGHVPFTNYLTWFFVSLVLATLFPLFRVTIKNRLALPLYIAQMIFFLMIIAISAVERLIKG
jgi:putative membrane protein